MAICFGVLLGFALGIAVTLGVLIATFGDGGGVPRGRLP
jgi:hypothetical protein